MATSKMGAGYASAIEVVVESHKIYVLLCGAPLVALVTQLQWLQSIDSVMIKMLMTVSVLCFVVRGAFSVFFLDLASTIWPRYASRMIPMERPSHRICDTLRKFTGTESEN